MRVEVLREPVVTVAKAKLVMHSLRFLMPFFGLPPTYSAQKSHRNAHSAIGSLGTAEVPAYYEPRAIMRAFFRRDFSRGNAESAHKHCINQGTVRQTNGASGSGHCHTLSNGTLVAGQPKPWPKDENSTVTNPK